MKIEKIDINLLKLAEYNPRKDLQPEDIEYKKIKRSIEEFGYVDPLIVNKDMTVIGGNQRLKVLKDLGHKEVDCVLLELDKTREKALNIALNKIEGEWDLPKLKDLLQELDTGEIDMDITGFEYTDLEKLMTQFYVPDEKDNEIPDIPEEPISKLGDLYKLGEHRLLCGDATNIEDVKRLMDGNKADMVFTDPPYDIEANRKKTKKFGGASKGDYFIIKFPEYNQWIPLVKESMKNNSSIYIFECWRNIKKLWEEIEKHFKIKNLIIWHSINRHSAWKPPYSYFNKYDICFYAIQGKPCFIKKSSTQTFDIISNIVASDYSTGQPYKLGAKPIEILIPYIQISSKRGNIILDLFGGAGSTLVACEKLNRKCYMMEIQPIFCDVIIKRYENYTNKKARLINGNTRA